MGDMYKVIDDYTEMLCKELNRIVDEKELTPTNLEIGEIIAETCKDFEKYKMMKYAEEDQDNYQRGYARDGYGNYGTYPDYMYRDGENYRASGNNYRGYESGSGSRNYGASRGSNYRNYGHEPGETKVQTIAELEKVMATLPEGAAREQIRQRIEDLKRL